MIRRLRWKFILINMALVTAILAAILAFVLGSVRKNLYADSISALEQAVTLSGTQDYGPGQGSSPNRYGLLGTDKVQLPYFTIQIMGVDTIFVLNNQFFDTSDTDALYDTVNIVLDSDLEIGELSLHGYSMRFLQTNTLMGQRIAFVDLTQEKSTLHSLTHTLLLVGGGALTGFFLISLLLAHWAVRPVEKSWKQQRQFVSDASHELKTPLAVIRSSLDMLESEPGAEEEKRQRWLENVRVSSSQMQTLVEEMLVLARSDNATQRVTMTRCDFSDIITSSLLLFEPVAFESGTRIQEAVPDGIFVHGDPGLLKRVADIYLDNACKYAAPDSTIRAALTCEGKRAVFSVYSAGAPIPREALSRIFERFYRLDASRTEEGYGLGLSIAAELAKLHHGKVWAQSDPTGNTFYFSLPRVR